MNALIVYAHPNPHSFNWAILEVVDSTLRERATHPHPRLVSDAMPGGDGW
jgi:putative NADPH-quinone reductase